MLSTIHTNDSASTVSRLVDMGIEPFLVSVALVGVVAQRLVRRICPKCKVTRPIDLIEMKLLQLEEPRDIHKGVGCANCNNTGYKGRIAIHEILVMNRELRKLVDTGASSDKIKQAAVASGTKTLRDSCIELVLNGTTTIEELIKVTYNTD